MIDIGQYIKKILTLEGDVVVPGLGAFTTATKPAEIKPREGILAPPSIQILFDDKQKMTSGNFLEFIKNDSGLSEEEIRDAIHVFSTQAKRKLDAGEHVRIEELGYLYKDKAYKVQFVQDTSENLLIENYGMDEIEWEMSQGAKTRKDAIVQTAGGKRNKLLIVPIAVLVVVILVLAMLISNKLGQDGQNSLLLGDLFQESSQTENMDPIEGQKQEIIGEIDSLTDKRNALYFDGQERPPQSNTFYLIAGSFSIYKNAEEYMNELRSKGYDAEVLEVDGKIFRVSMKSFGQKEEAVRELGRLQEMHQDRTLWILSSM
jgi:nucleoid DNA-binding protein